MSIFRWGSGFDPLGGFRQLQRELERLARPWTGQARRVGGGSYPPVNVYTSADEVLVQCEVAGVEPDDLDVSITGETLVIKGVKRPAAEAEDVKYIQQERGYGEFTRTIVLPDATDADKIDADLHDGVLTVRLPKTAAAAPRRVEIKS